MKSTFGAILALATSALAHPSLQGRAPAGHDFQAPRSGDVRSPCPGLNSLANHGFLNRNGKNITVPQLIQGGADGLGMGPDFMSSIGFLALSSPPRPNFQSFNLDELQEHNFPIEHDVSLTRKDFYIDGDDLTFYKPYYDEFISYFKGKTYTDLKSSALARRNRITYSFKNNPMLDYGPIAFGFGFGESGLYTQTMGMSPLATGARVDYVESLFLHERLPYELGWSKPVLPVTIASLGAFVPQIYSQTPNPLPVGVEAFGPGALATLIATQVAIVGKLYNVSMPAY